MAFVNAYDTRTGEKQVVPEQWLDIFDHLSKSPRQKAKEKAKPPRDAAKNTTPATGDTTKENPNA